MRPHMHPRTNIFGGPPEITECQWDDPGKECPNPPHEDDWFCLSHLEAGEADPDALQQQRAAVEFGLDEAGYL